MMVEKNKKKLKPPDVEAMLRETRTLARKQKLSKKKARPPTAAECRSLSPNQTDQLNCRKYIAQRMERAGQNSEYDSIFFLSMYR